MRCVDTAACAALMEHPDFTWTNPNRLRSVVSVFAAGNLKAFHAQDGAGYALVGDAVLKVKSTDEGKVSKASSPLGALLASTVAPPAPNTSAVARFSLP